MVVLERCRMYCIDEVFGKVLWKFVAWPYPDKISGDIYPPVIAYEKVFVATERGGPIYCLDLKSGKKIWEYSLEGKPPKLEYFANKTTSKMIHTPPLIVQDRMYLSYFNTVGGTNGIVCFKIVK